MVVVCREARDELFWRARECDGDGGPRGPRRGSWTSGRALEPGTVGEVRPRSVLVVESAVIVESSFRFGVDLV